MKRLLLSIFILFAGCYDDSGSPAESAMLVQWVDNQVPCPWRAERCNEDTGYAELCYIDGWHAIEDGWPSVPVLCEDYFVE